MRFPTGLGLSLLLLLSALVMGCGKGEKDKETPSGGSGGGRQATKGQLQRLGMAYHNFWDANGRGPNSVEELSRYYENDPGITDAIKSGRLVVYWKATMRGMTGGSSNTVLAYEKDPEPGTGDRLVLMGDAFVKPMTEAEFKAAPKAGS
jgi:hypothetical protein